MTTLTMKEVKEFLDNNPTFMDMDEKIKIVEQSQLPEQEKKQVLLRLAWDRAERRDYFKAYKELQKRNREVFAK
jgi:uncharacterized protein YigA (DUF484 family)